MASVTKITLTDMVIIVHCFFFFKFTLDQKHMYSISLPFLHEITFFNKKLAWKIKLFAIVFRTFAKRKIKLYGI